MNKSYCNQHKVLLSLFIFMLVQALSYAEVGPECKAKLLSEFEEVSMPTSSEGGSYNKEVLFINIFDSKECDQLSFQEFQELFLQYNKDKENTISFKAEDRTLFDDTKRGEIEVRDGRRICMEVLAKEQESPAKEGIGICSSLSYFLPNVLNPSKLFSAFSGKFLIGSYATKLQKDLSQQFGEIEFAQEPGISLLKIKGESEPAAFLKVSEDDDFAKIEMIYVRPQYRKNGFSKLLLIKLFQENHQKEKKVGAFLAGVNHRAFISTVVKTRSLVKALYDTPAVKSAQWFGYEVDFENSTINCDLVGIVFKKIEF
ncbi:MAG: hypothetical protein HQK50_19010 [Oligoflexia bacterium]|nr:hypothetical protein [Oligoflexia bacterium]